jgi:hypothetical protein
MLAFSERVPMDKNLLSFVVGAALWFSFHNVSLAQSCGTPEHPYGSFKGEIITKWDPGGRLMILVEPFGYVDPDCVEWSAPKGLITDGASIPRFLWTITGGPFEGYYRTASIIHDVYCITKSRPYQQVHKVFYNASRAAGEFHAKAWIMYEGVLRFGPSWTGFRARDALCDKFDSVTREQCTLNTIDEKSYAHQPTDDELREFFDDMRKQGYRKEADEFEVKVLPSR